ncbi:DUF3040 domain-containing protein [Parenemella sanctibonifatiensis]|uniref:DUF3040 domain-containing protein n=1 Tax=Parenemella sanctibonifatiensis TaxID=2016505 RepID=A0A255E9U7_9ACTN|nr:DUF3040 domain-containing protein [Parenemella sanctibonifatiensis]OYN88344.1 hypothetical protein CGZ92_05285 [Parenemella sanctibonifatiensis]
MALSEEEQRLLDQMEAAWAADDPHLDRTLRADPRLDVRPPTVNRGRLVVGGVLVAVGLVGLVAGISSHPAISVVGFVVMLAGVVLGMTGFTKHDVDDATPEPKPKASAGAGRSSAGPDKSFMDKMEERWRRRQDGSL